MNLLMPKRLKRLRQTVSRKKMNERGGCHTPFLVQFVNSAHDFFVSRPTEPVGSMQVPHIDFTDEESHQNSDGQVKNRADSVCRASRDIWRNFLRSLGE
jgi:hypothetical protein